MSNVYKAKRLIKYVGNYEIVRDNIRGHPLAELLSLKSRFVKGTKSSTTVYIHNPNKNTLQKQLIAISLQTVLPERVCIHIYDVETATISRDLLAELDISRSLFPDQTIQVTTTSESFSIHGRFQSLLEVTVDYYYYYYFTCGCVQCTTKYAWVIDADVIPGSSYLHLLLHSIQTAPYSHSILGAGGYILPVPSTGLSSSGTTGPGDVHEPGLTDDISASGVSSSDKDLLKYPNAADGIFADTVLEVDLLYGMWFLEAELGKYFFIEARMDYISPLCVMMICNRLFISLQLTCSNVAPGSKSFWRFGKRGRFAVIFFS